MSIFHFSSRRTDHWVFRAGPVPYTGKRSPYCYFRYPKTYQDNREVAGLKAEADDLPIHVDKLRQRHRLPTCWDDISRGSQRSWKEHRKKQWKG